MTSRQRRKIWFYCSCSKVKDPNSLTSNSESCEPFSTSALLKNTNFCTWLTCSLLIHGQCLTFVVDLIPAHAQRISRTGRLRNRAVPTVSGLFGGTMSTMAVAEMEVQQGDTRLPGPWSKTLLHTSLTLWACYSHANTLLSDWTICILHCTDFWMHNGLFTRNVIITGCVFLIADCWHCGDKARPSFISRQEK